MSFTRTYTIKPLSWLFMNGKHCAVCAATGMYVAYWQSGSGKWCAEIHWNGKTEEFKDIPARHEAQCRCEDCHRSQIKRQLQESGVV